MKRIKIACFDVYYYKDYAKACGVLFEVEPVERVFAHYCEEIDSVDGYVSGQFYKKELPCLLKVYNSIEEDIGLIIVDGFAFLGGGRKGLGGYLFEALDGRIAVIGVAKAFFNK